MKIRQEAEELLASEKKFQDMYAKELGRYPDTKEKIFRDRLKILSQTDEQKELDIKQ